MNILRNGEYTAYVFGALVIATNEQGKIIDVDILDAVDETENQLPDHGTNNRYKKGCKCEHCTKAHREYHKAYRIRTGRKK